MVDLKDAVSLLRAKRKELIDQLDAVDKALSALIGVARTVTMAPDANPPEAPERMNTVLPTRLNPPRTLSDEHKHALKEGRRSRQPFARSRSLRPWMKTARSGSLTTSSCRSRA